MPENLLRNGDFETDWGAEESHRCLVLPTDGDPYETDVGNIFTPPGWMTWFVHDPGPPGEPGQWDQPEVRDAWNHIDHHRVHTGQKATLLFTFWRKHHAGFYQQVQVTPGTQLSLSAYAHAWSNTNIADHPDCTDNPRCSAGAGTDAIAIPVADVPAPIGDPWQDALQNFAFCIGIDPTGGTNPLADTVQWGEEHYIYNDFFLLTAYAVAQAHTITVFLRSRTNWPFKHNDAYWDTVTLETADEPPPPPPPYQSTMLVLPQDATPDQLREIFTLAYPNRNTLGFSHDDAGTLQGTAILYNIPDHEVDAYLEFYATRYPNVKVEFAYTSDWPKPPSELLLWQCNEEWKDEKLASPGCAKTLCQIGCWVADCAIAQRYYGIEPYSTPSTVNQALADVGGFSGCQTTWAGMEQALGLQVVKRSYDDVEAQEWLDTGNILFAEVEPETFMHFVTITRHREGRFWMLDPYKNVEGWLDEHYPGIESWRLIRPFAPAPPPPPPLTAPSVSLHLQSLVEGALDFVDRVKPSVVKVFQLEAAQAIKARSPNTLVLLRYFTGDQHLSGDLEAAAQAYVRSFQDSLQANAHWIDFVESWNETIATHDLDGIHRAVEFDCHFADALMALDLPVAPQLLNVAVGNPYHLTLLQRLLHRLFPTSSLSRPPSMGPPATRTLPQRALALSEIELMLPAVRQAVKYNGTIGYHAYGQALAPYGNLNDDWPYFAGRALENWDPVFRAHGLYPRYIFGECGAFSTCNDGWRSPSCLDGNWPRYLDQLTEFSSRIDAWNAQHGNRCLGATLFTSGGWGWDTFEIAKAQMEDPNWPT